MKQTAATTDPAMAQRVRRHLLSQLLCLGRHTLTGVLGTAGRLFCDWSADYRLYAAARVRPAQLFAPVRQAVLANLAAPAPVVVALDDTRLRKSGMKTCGVKYTRDPLGPAFHVNFIKAQRFVQLSLAAPTSQGGARLIPVDFVHAPAPRRPAANADLRSWEQFRCAQRAGALPKVGAERLQALRTALDAEAQRQRPLWAVVDGGYTNRTLLRNLPPRTVVVGRIRADAKLYELPPASGGQPGRRRVYGTRAATPEQLRQDARVPWQRVPVFAAGRSHDCKIKSLAPLRWRAAGKDYDLRLVVIAPLGYRLTPHGKLLYRKPAYLICTDPQVAVAELLQAYVWRWEIEVNFRDEKTLLGVGQAQVRHAHSVERVPALAVAAYAMLLTAAGQVYGPTDQPAILPAPKWRRRKRRRASTQSLLQHLRHEVWAQALRFSNFAVPDTPNTKPQKLMATLPSALFYAVA